MGAVPEILLAEDNPADVYLLREALRLHEVECDLRVFEDGAAALAFIIGCLRGEHRRPDLLIIDLNLPKVEGRQLLRHVRGIRAFKTTPVIVWTSSGQERDRRETEKLGADYVSKPSQVAAFLAIGGSIKALLAAGGN